MAELLLTEAVRRIIGPAVNGDVLRIEAGLVAMFAFGVDGQLGQRPLERTAIVGIPIEVGQFLFLDAGVGDHLLVVEDGDGVPVLG
jgi:hypothetical protein